MSYTGSESPGSIKNQVGRSLNEIRDCVSREDVVALANHVRYLVAISSPLVEDKKRESLRVGQVENAGELFERCMRVLEELLPILAAKGMYAWVAGDVGDAGDLALGAEEDTGEGAEP